MTRVHSSKKTTPRTRGRCESSGKVRFVTQRDAVKQVGLTRAKNASKREKVLADVSYRCPACDDWHLTRNGR